MRSAIGRPAWFARHGRGRCGDRDGLPVALPNLRVGGRHVMQRNGAERLAVVEIQGAEFGLADAASRSPASPGTPAPARPASCEMTSSTSEVAVCCSSASVSSRVRACTSSNSRTFSIAITAWSAKVVTSSICLSVNGRTALRCKTMTPIGVPSRSSGTPSSGAKAAKSSGLRNRCIPDRPAHRECERSCLPANVRPTAVPRRCQQGCARQ